MEQLLLPMGELGFHHILLGLAGGMVGACLGCLQAFILCGIFVIIGVAVSFIGAGGPVLLNSIAFGSVFGPHVAFAGGAAAAAYAGSKKYLDSGRDIISPLASHPDAILVGGLFGSLGVVLAWIFQSKIILGWGGLHWTDSVALTVFVSAVLARILFGETGIFGKIPEDMSRYKVSDENAWMPYCCKRRNLLLVGLGFGLLSAYLCRIIGVEHGGIVIGFGISAVSLIFALVGLKIPTTHHITVIAAGATAASGGSIVWGGLFGIAAAFVGEFWSRTFLIHGDSHIDPPATTIWSLWLIIVIFGYLGVYAAIPLL